MRGNFDKSNGPPQHPPQVNLRIALRRVLRAQGALTLAATLICIAATTGYGAFDAAGDALALSWARVQALWFGAGLGVCATLITAKSVLHSARIAQHADLANAGLLPLFAGLGVKLIVVAGGAFIALARLDLAPLWLMFGFLIAQGGYFWAADMRPQPRHQRRDES